MQICGSWYFTILARYFSAKIVPTSAVATLLLLGKRKAAVIRGP